ncbi:PREDICTED: putative late blight resistance protein homolog R1A-10, partial [Erythranthe guttata]|uniref:putative late blight resistance protein homolog R1A-10 n=1 Tax=Erythranthe guttata TaxID=4155 RepID=UPI00064DD89F
MVGLSDLFMRLRDWLISPHSELIVMSLDGMAGIGKTTIAKKLFQDPFIASHYSRLVFVTIGPKYRLADILVDILTQLNNADIDEIIWLTKGEELLHELKWKVCESLSELRYLIVLDDVWYTDLCYEFANVFPDDKNGSVALLTTRLTEVSKCVHPLNSHRLPFLDKKESWELLRHKVFDAMPCPRELEKSGKKIAENCEGLPLTIVTVAHILSKTDKTSVYWNQVANDKQNSVYKDAYDQMSNVLYPSYDYLPQHLKACFLYLGAFPQDYMVWRRQLIDLWSAEGFLNRKSTMTSTDYTFAYVGALLSNNVIIYNEEKLLRVLEALSIKSYEFPMEVLKLLQLRYLALTYDGNLPTFISKLFNLQYLIVHHQYRIVKSVRNPYYLPIEIWNMKELKSLEIRGRDLPHPCEGSLLSNLTTLTGVGPQSCTNDVLEKIPNLKELTIQIELVPDASEPFSCFDHIYNMHQLQELECEITNPIFKAEVVTRFGPLSDLPSSLTKLTLSVLGYPWEEMRKISSLPNLTDL